MTPPIGSIRMTVASRLVSDEAIPVTRYLGGYCSGQEHFE